MKRRAGVVAGMATGVVLATAPAGADAWGVSLYGGWNGSLNSDVRFTGPGTDWTLHSVPWDGLSFTQAGGPPFYGARLTYWPSAMRGWGFALEFTHAKARAVGGATVSYSGTFSGSDQIQNLFQTLEFTDGLNLVTLNALYQLQPYGMIRPYVGAGAGISIPHVEVTGNGGTVPFPRTFAYEFGGPAVVGLIGAEVALTRRVALFGEFKVTGTTINSPMNGGYEIHTTMVISQVVAGATYKFGP